MRRLGLLAALALSSACDASSPLGPGEVAEVTIQPASARIEVGHSLALTSLLVDVNGDPVTGVTAVWRSSSPQVTIAPDGRVTGTAPGMATITATAGGRRGTAIVRVLPAVASAAGWRVALAGLTGTS
ncbi:MAG: Ig-like domain-containing protein, partial [Gemmatimonadota bacterium]